MAQRARGVRSDLLQWCALAALGGWLVQPAPAQQHLPVDDSDHMHRECGCGKANALRLRAQAGLPIADGAGPGYASREALTATDVISNDLDFEVVPATQQIIGSNTMVVRSRVDGLTQFTFMLRSNFTITSATINGATPVTVSGPPANSYARTVTLNRAYNTGEEFTLRIAYNGVAVSRGFGSIEFQTTSAGNPVVASLSEAYFAATWWPVKDGDVFLPGDNSDKATIKIAITAPDTLRSVANGLLLGVDTIAGGKKKYRWQSNYPTSTYLVAFCSTVYNTWTQNFTYPLPGGGTGSMPVEFNIYPQSDNPTNRAAWERCIPMLGTFGEVYGEYPFINEKYGIYQFPFGGGMEHQTNSGQGGFGESLTAHELAHQWWGDHVTCKTWNDIWLNEGFATYSEAIWAERKAGSTGLPALHAAMAARRPSAITDSVYVYDAANMNRIFSGTYTYNKAAWVLHQLRHILGDAAFFQSLLNYRNDFGGSAATTDNFRDSVEATTGRDLDRFFQQCVYGFGAPQYAFGWQNATIGGQPYLRLHVRQVQDASWPGGGAPAGSYEFPIDVRVDSASGSSTVVIQNDARQEHYLIPLTGVVTGAATAVTLDEFDWILNTGKASEAYIQGPAKVVSASPAPASTGEAPATLTVAFSENVAATLPRFTLTGPSGSVPLSLAYSGTTFVATLTPGAPLAPGAYTLSVADSVSTVANGALLDGEFTGAFPSGNGQPGGAAAWSFTVEGATACGSADFDGDGDTGTDADIEAFFACLGGNCCGTCGTADFDGDGDTGTDADIEAFFRVLGGGAC